MRDQWSDVRRSDMVLVPQATGMSFRAASAATVVACRDQVMVEPQEGAKGSGKWAAYVNGSNPSDVAAFARAWTPFQSNTVGVPVQRIRNNGPLWVRAAVPGLHAIAVPGVYGDKSTDDIFARINVPWRRDPVTPDHPGSSNNAPGRPSQYALNLLPFIAEYEGASSGDGVTCRCSMPPDAPDPAARARLRRPALRLTALVAMLAVASGCTVQLTAPYSSEIDIEAAALQSDFLRFAAGMQLVAGTPKGYYDQHGSDYGDFEARLAVIRLRSESLSGGVPCNRALQVAKAAQKPLAVKIEQSVADAGTLPGGRGASCVTILTGLAQRNMERLRSQHAVRCDPGAKPILCTTLFGSPPIFDMLVPGPSEAPLVSAVAITLNEIVAAERDLRPDGER